MDKEVFKTFLKSTFKDYLNNLSPSDIAKLRDTIDTGVKIAILFKLIKEGKINLNDVIDDIISRNIEKLP